MKTAIIYRTTVPKEFKFSTKKVRKKLSRKQKEEYIRLWQKMAIDLSIKP